MRRLIALLIVGLLLAPPASAQSIRPGTVISINPFLPLLGFFQGEVERRLRDNLAFAVAGSYIEPNDRIANLDAKLRLYPQEKAPYGLGLAAGVGVGALRETIYREVTCTAIGCPTPGSTTTNSLSPSISMEIHYQWLLGRKQQTAVGFGFGAKRYLAGGSFPEFIPTGRITVGYAFGR